EPDAAGVGRRLPRRAGNPVRGPRPPLRLPAWQASRPSPGCWRWPSPPCSSPAWTRAEGFGGQHQALEGTKPQKGLETGQLKSALTRPLTWHAVEQRKEGERKLVLARP